MSQSFDVVVLGGGTGGYVAAIRAAQLGLRVAVVEKDRVGGTCLHRGCIPSKAYLKSAEVLDTLRRAAEYGIAASEAAVDFGAVYARKERIVETLCRGVEGLLKKNGVTLFSGVGALVPPSIFAPGGSVAVDAGGQQELLEFGRVIVATGSRPKRLGIPVDGHHVMTSDEALARRSLPHSVVIVGGGAIGMEWASLYRDFGAEVTVLEALPRILAGEDEEVAAELARQMGRRGVAIHTGAAIRPESVQVETGAGAGAVSLEAEVAGERRTFTAEALLLAVGREPVTTGFGLENRERVTYRQGGFIEADPFGRTGDPAIYAIGDVVGGGLAHVAARQGVIAVEQIKGLQPDPFDPARVARCVYTRPEVAAVGWTEAEARAQGRAVKVGRVPWRAIGKAHVEGTAEGFVKVVADAESGDVLGVHLIGPDATNLISEAGLALLLNASAWEIGRLIHPHPTLSEILGEAALAVDGQAIHI